MPWVRARASFSTPRRAVFCKSATARTLDLDLIAYGREVIEEEGGFVLPHPRAADRLFVMGPLAEIAPGWPHPVSHRTAAELASTAQVGRDARPI